jgi:precorrin-3B C17-methyltransferase
MQNEPKGKILLVGLGPGDHANLTYAAQAALSEASVIVGYRAYLELAASWLPVEARLEPSEITHELERAQRSIELAQQGQQVALVCSGDSGVYALAGLVLEILAAQGWRPGSNPEVKVLPGVSAVNSCAALLGAPLMHDFCTISLSDLLTPWSVIRARVEAAAQADFVICFYNPRSQKRLTQLSEAREILLQQRPPTAPVGLVRQAYREGQWTQVITLGELAQWEAEVEMNTVVIVGNRSSFALDGLIITPRGYKI